MALVLRSVNICSFIDGAREQGGIRLDLGKDFPVVRSGCVCVTPLLRGLKKKE